MDEELDRSGRLTHRDRDVFDFHVLLELEDESDLLLGRQVLDQGPDPAQLIPVGSQVLERGPCHPEVVEVIEGLGRSERVRYRSAMAFTAIWYSQAAKGRPVSWYRGIAFRALIKISEVTSSAALCSLTLEYTNL